MSKVELMKDLVEYCNTKKNSIVALKHIDKFVNSAVLEAAIGESYSFFGHMRSAGSLLEKELGKVNTLDILKEPDTRVLPFLRSQLFISLIANVEDFFTQVIRFILLSYPSKIQLDKVEVKNIVGLGSVREQNEYLVDRYINQIFYESPKEYRKKIEEIISATKDILEPYWEDYIEMKATRDIGMHSAWKVNHVYISKSGNKARSKKIGESLFISQDYFELSINTCELMVNAVEEHLRTKFSKNNKSNAFKEMWEKSSLNKVVSFEQAWNIESDSMIRPKSGFSWAWSHSEQILFDFFMSIYTGKDMPSIKLMKNHLYEKDIFILNQWLEEPFEF
jgi:hypothetical protein